MKRKILDVRKYLIEIKVGMFLLGAVFILFIAAMSMKEVSFLKGSYLLKVKFTFAEGLRPASPVRFCGVDVGEVKTIKIEEKDQDILVCVYAKISNSVKIPDDSQFFINSLTLFGEKYLEIVPPEDNTVKHSMLKAGSEVMGISSTPLFQITSSFHKTMVKLDEFINENEIRDSLKDIVLNVKSVTRDFRDILQGVKNKEGTLGKFIYDDSLYTNTEEFISDLKQHPWKLFYKPRESGKKKR